MKALRHLNKYLFKYRYQLLLGIIITVIGRIFSLVAPRLIGNSLTAVEQFLKKGETDPDALQKELLINILISNKCFCLAERIFPYLIAVAQRKLQIF